jgi:radical SAM protein
MISVFQRQKEDAAQKNGRGQLVYSEAPFLVYWELTRACDLACRHCRAEAMAERSAEELTLEEIQRVLKGIKGFGRRLPHLVLTGGDPLKRPDFFDILDYADRLELRLSVAPSGTPLLTREVFQIFRATGVESISLSFDGSSREKHDGFRGVPGCFDRTVEAAHQAREEGLGLQINTLVTAETEEDLPHVYRLVSSLDPMRWSLFFLIPVGRGHGLKPVSPERGEAIYNWLYDLSREAPFAVATTEAPHFRRVALTRMKEQGLSWSSIRQTPVGRGFGIRDGNGIMFISHTGDVYPSGFLPIVAGNVRSSDIAEIYRGSEVFRQIRQTSDFKGRCGRCEFKEICGGSRARAYAASGDCLDEDPACSYQPGQTGGVGIDTQENQPGQ